MLEVKGAANNAPNDSQLYLKAEFDTISLDHQYLSDSAVIKLYRNCSQEALRKIINNMAYDYSKNIDIICYLKS